jgi:hypothetical protein
LLLLRPRATSDGGCSLRSAGGHLDWMDRMDGMDPEGEALHLVRSVSSSTHLLLSSSLLT